MSLSFPPVFHSLTKPFPFIPIVIYKVRLCISKKIELGELAHGWSGKVTCPGQGPLVYRIPLYGYSAIPSISLQSPVMRLYSFSGAFDCWSVSSAITSSSTWNARSSLSIGLDLDSPWSVFKEDSRRVWLKRKDYSEWQQRQPWDGSHTSFLYF